MPGENNVSPKAQLVAVITALIVGFLGSLALRPPGALRDTAEAMRQESGIEPIRWRLTSSFTNAMPVIGTAPAKLAAELREVSSGAIDLQLYEPGKVVPALEITESIRDGKVEAGFMWVGYDQGRIPASTLIASVPFGMEPMEFAAWWYYDEGRQLGEAMYAEHNVMPILCSVTGPETAGWFREPIETLDDLVGLKIRFAGLGGKILQRLGASVTMIPGGEIYQALEKGAIDASEFSLPVVDQMLGFGRVAKFNYFPGWHQTFSSAHLLVNLETWRALNAETQALIRLACKASVTDTMVEAESLQGPIIRDFSEQGVTAKTLPTEILRELQRVSVEVLDEEAEKDEYFARILASQRRFSENYRYWKQKGYLPRDF